MEALAIKASCSVSKMIMTKMGNTRVKSMMAATPRMSRCNDLSSERTRCRLTSLANNTKAAINPEVAPKTKGIVWVRKVGLALKIMENGPPTANHARSRGETWQLRCTSVPSHRCDASMSYSSGHQANINSPESTANGDPKGEGFGSC